MNGGGTQRRAPWITFEGTEGVGKTTQIERLAARLEHAGRIVRLTREPGGTALGRRLRAVLLEPTDRPMAPVTELLLYTADRAQHLTEVILPSLFRGEVVLCDRFLDATLAYQGHARGLGFETVLDLHRQPPLDSRPDRTVLLDMPAQRALGRALDRNADSGQQASEGRFEAERLEFHERVRAGYLALARDEPERIRVVRADGEADEVEALIVSELSDLFPEIGGARSGRQV
jgi:dTMP kinase